MRSRPASAGVCRGAVDLVASNQQLIDDCCVPLHGCQVRRSPACTTVGRDQGACYDEAAHHLAVAGVGRIVQRCMRIRSLSCQATVFLLSHSQSSHLAAKC